MGGPSLVVWVDGVVTDPAAGMAASSVVWYDLGGMTSIGGHGESLEQLLVLGD